MPTTTSLGTFGVELTEAHPTEDGHGKRSVVVGHRYGDIVIQIDRDKLLPYAQKALRSKRGRCQMGQGGIVLLVAKKTLRDVRK